MTKPINGHPLPMRGKDPLRAIDMAVSTLEMAKWEDKVKNLFKLKLNFRENPRPNNVAIRLKGIDLCGFGEFGTINAAPGAGKSNIAEALACSYIAKQLGMVGVDTLEFEVAARDKRKILWIDTERTKDDNLITKNRILDRLGISEDTLEEHLDYFQFVELATYEEVHATLADIMSTWDYGFCIIDGLLEFSSLLDEKKAADGIRNIRRLAVQHDMAIVTTLHPNKGTETMAGHAGAYAYRYSRFCLLVRPLENGVREITSDFCQGKLSKSNKPVSSCFNWDENSKMMVSSEKPEKSDKTPLQRIESDDNALYNLVCNTFNGSKIIHGAQVFKNALNNALQSSINGSFSEPRLNQTIRLVIEKGYISKSEGKRPDFILIEKVGS